MGCSPQSSSVHGILQAKNTGVRSLSLLQGFFLTQRVNLNLLHCWQIIYYLSHQGSPYCVFVCVCVCMDLDLSSMGLYVILCASWTSVTYLSHVRQILAIIPSNNFSSPFSLFFFDTCNMYVGSFNVVPEVSETVLISLHSFSFIVIHCSCLH